MTQCLIQLLITGYSLGVYMIYESVTQIVIFLLRLFDLNDLYMSEAKITEKSEKMNRILC